MKTERKTLLEALEFASMGLAASSVVPIMNHYWFDGKTVTTYNDKIAVSVPFKTDFEAAIPQQMFGVLKTALGSTIDLVASDTELSVKCGRMKAKFNTLRSKGIFTMPDSDENNTLKVNMDDFIERVDWLLHTTMTDSSIPELMGVVIDPFGNWLEMRTSNSVALSLASVPCKNIPFSSRVVLPMTFCTQIVKLHKAKKRLKLEIHDDYALLLIDDKKIYSRLLEVEQSFNFKTVIDRVLFDGWEDCLIDIPTKKLDRILERTVAVCLGSERVKTDVSVLDGMMHFKSSGNTAHLHDKVQVPDHADLETVAIESWMMKDGVNFFDQFCITEDALIMTKDDIVYLVSVMSSQKLDDEIPF